MTKRFVLLHEMLAGAEPRPVIINLDHVKIIAANLFWADRTGTLLLFSGQSEDYDSIIVTETFEEIRKNIPL